MGLLEPQHLIILALVLLLFFGGKKIPELMKGLGRGVKDFKEAQNGIVHPEPSAEAADQTKVNTEKTDRADA